MSIAMNPAITLLYGQAPSETEDIRSLLDPAGFKLTAHPFDPTAPAAPEGTALILIEASREQASHVCAMVRRWRAEWADRYVAVVWLLPTDCADLLVSGLEAGVDLCLHRPFDLIVLVAQLRALVRTFLLHQRLRGRAAEAQVINQRLQVAYQQIDNDLELTRRIHRGFLPRSLPDVLLTKFAVCYRPRSRIGGDFYDVLRLDEDHVAIFVADAMGRGVPASSLLSIYVKKCLTPKEIIGRSYRLIPPDEVLLRLNRELVALGLPDPPFMTMTYVQLNCRDGNLQYARAGHPLPLHIPREGTVEYWHATGPFLGIFEADFPAHQAQLRPGDKLLLCSDGAQQLEEDGRPHVPDRLLEAVYRHRGLPVQGFVDHTARDLLEQSRNADDFTLLALEFAGPR